MRKRLLAILLAAIISARATAVKAQNCGCAE
ncbi:hypothetical protein Goari_026445, partial [Gossypium aridum]|nr:hypothetical protein [Gossypium aridum]